MVDESLLMLQPQETPDIDCLMQVARFLIEFDYRMITKLQLSAMMSVEDKKLLSRLGIQGDHHRYTEKIFRLFMTACINDDVLDDDAIGRFHMNIKHGLMI